MERLTRRKKTGYVWYVDDTTDKKCLVHDMSAMDIIHAMNRLCELEDKIEHGELVEQKQGEWILVRKFQSGPLEYGAFACSVCGNEAHRCFILSSRLSEDFETDFDKYCLDCGSRNKRRE